MRTRASLLLIGMTVLPGAAAAQGFDCTKARTPVEQAICATPGLLEQDRALNAAYTARLAREPAQAATLRTEQRTWLASRDRICASRNEPVQRVASHGVPSAPGKLSANTKGDAAGVVTVTTLEYPELPAALVALTRKR